MERGSRCGRAVLSSVGLGFDAGSVTRHEESLTHSQPLSPFQTVGVGENSQPRAGARPESPR